MKRLILALTLVGALLTPITAHAQTAQCQFVLGFKQLYDVIGYITGDCIENEWSSPPAADGTVATYQNTVNGHFAWIQAAGIIEFVEGERIVNGVGQVRIAPVIWNIQPVNNRADCDGTYLFGGLCRYQSWPIPESALRGVPPSMCVALGHVWDSFSQKCV